MEEWEIWMRMFDRALGRAEWQRRLGDRYGSLTSLRYAADYLDNLLALY